MCYLIQKKVRQHLMNDSHPANIFLSAMQWIGKTVSINNLHNHLDLIDNARNEAKKHDWLHHCTNRQAFLSMLRSNKYRK